MDIIEFEIRYSSFEWLSQKFQLGWSTEQICKLCAITEGWTLVTKLNETEPNEIKKLTLQSYSDFKKFLINQSENTILSEQNNQNYTLADYIHRIEYELKVIKEMWFNSYLLVVADFINRSKHHQIPVGPGRGSAAGSLVAWLIGITDVDPLPFGLLFERFLNPARVNMPDIDTDFDDEQREKVFEYVRGRYGHDFVAKIGTFMNMSAKAAFKDVARVMGIPFDMSNRISSLFTILNDDRSVNFMRCWEEIDELKAILEGDDRLQEIVHITDNLIGTYRQTGVHACGIIIGPEDLTNYLPQQLSPNVSYSADERNVTQYDYNVAKIEDTIGVIKMDFLGLGNLSIIKNTIKIIEKRHTIKGEPLPDIFKNYLESSTFEPPIDDLNVYETIFQKWNTTWIFQFESEGMKKFLILLKPDRLDDIVAMSALYRPWPIEFIPSFIHRKRWEEPIEYMYPELYQVIRTKYSEEVAQEEKRKLEEDLLPILETTYGVAVFQEQLMFMSQSLAGFSFAQADELRRWIGKKIVAVVKKMKEEFIEKSQSYRNYKEETANWVFEKMIEPAALYSFNKSHSVAYSLVAFQTAYLKTYYPIEFHAALIRANENNTDELSKFINEIKFQWLKLLWPDINESYNHVAAIDDYIRLGFLCIKGVGSEVWETIQRERQSRWNFTDLADFLTRCQSIVTKKSLEWLIKSWALDGFVDRGALLENVDHLLEWAKSSKQIADGWLFGDGFGKKSLDLKVKIPLDKMSILRLEYEAFKTFISFHPLDGLYARVKGRGYNMISQFKNRNYDKEQMDFGAFTIVALVTKITRARKKGFFIKVEDFSDSIEFFVKDPLDISEFDLLIISWYRGKWSPRWKKLIKASLERLIEVASSSWKYNPNETVFEVKKRRLGITSVAQNPHGKNTQTDWDSSMDADALWLEMAEMSDADRGVIDKKLLKTVARISSDSHGEWMTETGEGKQESDYISSEENWESKSAYMDDLDILDPIGEFSLEDELNDEIADPQQDKPSDEFSDDLENPSKDEHDDQDNQKDQEIAHNTTGKELETGTSGYHWDSFDLPNDIQTIKQLQVLIKSHQGNRRVNIGGMEVGLDDEGLIKIQKLLHN